MTTTLKVQAFFARPLSKRIPKARIVSGVNRDYICRDQDYLDDCMADPLTVLEPITARMGAETLKAMRALEAGGQESGRQEQCAVQAACLDDDGVE